MKKSKVYSHTQLRIYFPDGSRIEAKFLPSETISVVKQQTMSAFLPALQSQIEFDLYITPPRIVLKDSKTLAEEGLVPAAKVHVSWKKQGSSFPDSFLQPFLFDVPKTTDGTASFPASKSLTDSSVEKKSRTTPTSRGLGESREEELIKRMMGKKKEINSGKSNSSLRNVDSTSRQSHEDKKPEVKGRPKWFKG